MSALVIEGGEVEVRAEAGSVEIVVERQKDSGGPSMRLRMVLDPESADQLGTDIIAASTRARSQS